MEWWCELFGYFNCRSMPAADTAFLGILSSAVCAVVSIYAMNRAID
jgi:hypothetical protein